MELTNWPEFSSNIPVSASENGGETECMKKKNLLQKLRVCAFALTEARLYLDTHPDDRKALSFYREHMEMFCTLKKEWESCTGEPLDQQASRWNWVNTPWPWQSEL